jgi:hypothetical protein
MKMKMMVLCAFLLVLACNKENNTTTFSSDAPECVKNITSNLQGRTVKKWTDGSSFYWSVDNNGNPAIDAQFIYYLNSKCDTVCRICFCPRECKIDVNTLTEVK